MKRPCSDEASGLKALLVEARQTWWTAISIAVTIAVLVASPRVVGISEQVEDGVTGMLVPPGDAPRPAKAVIDLLRNPEEAVQLGKAGAQRAADALSWKAVAKMAIQCSQRAIADRREGPSERVRGGR